MHEIRKMIDAGELTIDALKWKVRRDPMNTDASTLSGTIGTSSVSKFFSDARGTFISPIKSENSDEVEREI